jgi:hypothetical protein
LLGVYFLLFITAHPCRRISGVLPCPFVVTDTFFYLTLVDWSGNFVLVLGGRQERSLSKIGIETQFDDPRYVLVAVRASPAREEPTDVGRTDGRFIEKKRTIEEKRRFANTIISQDTPTVVAGFGADF